jgi:hypothetical protein
VATANIQDEQGGEGAPAGRGTQGLEGWVGSEWWRLGRRAASVEQRPGAGGVRWSEGLSRQRR